MKVDIDYLNKNIIVGFVILIAIIFLLFNSSQLHLDNSLKILLTFSLFIFAGLLLRRSNKFVSGQIGEKDVEIELKKLGEKYVCINGLETGHGNIDKIVLGPTGIWTLEVKSHKGSVTFENDSLIINGKIPEKDFLKQSYAEAKYLEDLIKSKLNLEIKVQPVLVFSDKFAKVRLGMRTCRGVYVVGINWLNKLLTETHVQSLDEDVILKIKDDLKFKGTVLI
ncbi:MAG: NERD domain protein [Candidatus Woesebacteria bacterium GW2011_GWC1_38_13]|uniref:NERD domain protein n=2 Tax=Candidatus Woeseibacteriota TaxID=1752722 RepID=A0A0G0L545_9BACT|nr:MAG: NERD domain protein [Candidatus Woesebacteria bacterium GW2011_GWC1_38_13]KKQ83005.1 MAG: NERD domain protein [Candidatus Woesebacteria bacterium GW2011_GWA1_38_8]